MEDVDSVLYCLESLSCSDIFEDGIIDVQLEDEYGASCGCEIAIPDLAQKAIAAIKLLQAKIVELTPLT